MPPPFSALHPILLGITVAWVIYYVYRERRRQGQPNEYGPGPRARGRGRTRTRKCTICNRNIIDETEAVQTLRCGCFFHTDCINILLDQDIERCPQCQEPFWFSRNFMSAKKKYEDSL